MCVRVLPSAKGDNGMLYWSGLEGIVRCASGSTIRESEWWSERRHIGTHRRGCIRAEEVTLRSTPISLETFSGVLDLHMTESVKSYHLMKVKYLTVPL